jgi:hypothetical protein
MHYNNGIVVNHIAGSETGLRPMPVPPALPVVVSEVLEL